MSNTLSPSTPVPLFNDDNAVLMQVLVTGAVLAPPDLAATIFRAEVERRCCDDDLGTVVKPSPISH